MKSDKIKLYVALGILLIAGVLFAMRSGLFGGGGGDAANLPKVDKGDPNARGGGPRTAPPIPGAK